MRVTGKRLKRVCDLLSLVPSTPGLPASVFIGLEGGGGGLKLRLASSVSVQAGLKGTGDGINTEMRAVDRRVLFPFIGDTGDYDLEMKNDVLLVKQGHRSASIRTVGVDWSYGEWQSGSSTVLPLSEDTKAAIRCARLCASEDPIMQQLNCVRVDVRQQAWTFASNDLAMCCSRGSGGGAAAQIAFPLNMVDVLVREDIPSVVIVKDTVAVVIEGVRIWAQAPKKAWTDFPLDQLKRLIVRGRKAEPIFSVKTQELQRVVGAFAGYLGNIPTTEWELRLSVKKDAIATQAHTPYAKFNDRLMAKVRREVDLEINLATLVPIVEFLNGRTEDVTVGEGGGSVYVRSGDYEFLLSQRAKGGKE